MKPNLSTSSKSTFGLLPPDSNTGSSAKYLFSSSRFDDCSLPSSATVAPTSTRRSLRRLKSGGHKSATSTAAKTKLRSLTRPETTARTSVTKVVAKKGAKIALSTAR